MKKQKEVYVIVSMDFCTMVEASIFYKQLLATECGFEPIVKEIRNSFVVCRVFRFEDKDDEELYLSDDTELNDGEEQQKWIYIEEK